MLTQYGLKERLHYDPETGVFKWVGPLRGSASRMRAGHLKPDGYRTINLQGRQYLEHRLAWFYMTGEWPLEIDHINRCPADNRFSNLRLADRTINTTNTDVRCDNHLGIKGVRQIRSGKFDARIRRNNQRYNLGTFATVEEAEAAYQEADVRLRAPS